MIEFRDEFSYESFEQLVKDTQNLKWSNVAYVYQFNKFCMLLNIVACFKKTTAMVSNGTKPTIGCTIVQVKRAEEPQ